MIGFHITISNRHGATLFLGEEGLRRAIRALGRSAAGSQLALFCLVDDHLHAVLARDDRRLAGRLAQAMGTALKPVVSVPMEPAYYEEIGQRRHLLRLVEYVLTQTAHHGIGVHPALWDGSCFQDLVGARLVDGVRPPLKAVLPRFRVRDLLEAVGLPPAGLKATTDEVVRQLGAARVVAAASSAVAVDPSLEGRSAPVMAARRAAAQLAGGAGISSNEIAFALGCTTRSVNRLRQQPQSADVIGAVRTRLALEELVAVSAALAGKRRQD